MGKEGDLWDDSALISAFDRAISTYKIMHSRKNKDNSDETMQMTSGIGEIESNNDSENPETRSDAGEKSSILANAHLGEASYGSYLEENDHADSEAVQPCLDSLVAHNMGHFTDVHNNYSHDQGVDHYNRLVGQYYELEEQRQKVLEQLNQYGGWNYQYTAPVLNSGVPYSNSGDCSMSASHVCDPNVRCSCCACCGLCMLPPCASGPGCSLFGTCVGKPCNDYSVKRCPEKLFPYEDDKIVKTAMGVAERAMSAISGDLDKKDEKERNHSEVDQHNDLETDLSVVLNAWYSAGLYTGRFLTQRSNANRRQG